MTAGDEISNDVVLTEADEQPEVDERPKRLRAVLPVLLGVLVLGLNLVLFMGQRGIFLAKDSGGTAATALLALSVFTGFLLLFYPFLLRRMEADAGDSRWFSRWVVVPLILGILAPMATIRAVENYYPTRITQGSSVGEPCLELYQKAASIRAENPFFRMPDNDRDERRCKINETVLR
jgi:hypothetical protein